MSLSDEPRQDVETFGGNMVEMARQISIIGSAPLVLSILVATDFIDCKVLDFQMKYTVLHNLVYINPKSLSAYEITSCTVHYFAITDRPL